AIYKKQIIDLVTFCEKIEADLQIQDDLFENRLQKHQHLAFNESKPADKPSHVNFNVQRPDSPVRGATCQPAPEPSRKALSALSTTYINELAMSQPTIATKIVLIQPTTDQIIPIDGSGGPKAQAPACSQQALENPLGVSS
uniref:Uncharacterized protein n=1 Tax=Romanomermis culicivorax TaxID=13658 RepID=A0A915KUF6_ROMCU